MAEGGSFGAAEESTATGVRRVKRRDSCTEARRRPALTSLRGLSAPPLGRAWLGAEAPASVLAGRESVKKSAAAEETFSCLFVLWRARRGVSERRLNELQRRARAAAISADPRDGQEMLRLLLPPPRSLCASTGHSPHHPPGSRCSPPPPGSRDPGKLSRRTHGTPRAAATSRRL